MENMKELRAQLARNLKGVERILKIGVRDFDDSFRDNEVGLGYQVRYNRQFSFGRSVINGEVYNCIHIRNIFFDPNKYGESLQVYIERIMGGRGQNKGFTRIGMFGNRWVALETQ